MMVKNYIKDFKCALDFYSKNQVSLEPSDSKILLELSKLLSETIDFSVPLIPEEYVGYSAFLNIEDGLKKNKKVFDYDMSYSFSFDFHLINNDLIFQNNKSNLFPCILFKIKNKDGSLSNLSKIIGEKIEGDLIFMVRKINNKWELPIYAIEENSSRDIIIFKKTYFDLEVKKTDALMKKINDFYKAFLIQKEKKFEDICLSESENLYSSKDGVLIPESFLSKKNKNKKIINKLDNESNSVNYLNELYELSIKI